MFGSKACLGSYRPQSRGQWCFAQSFERYIEPRHRHPREAASKLNPRFIGDGVDAAKLAGMRVAGDQTCVLAVIRRIPSSNGRVSSPLRDTSQRVFQLMRAKSPRVKASWTLPCIQFNICPLVCSAPEQNAACVCQKRSRNQHKARRPFNTRHNLFAPGRSKQFDANIPTMAAL